MARQDQYNVTVSINGVQLGTFDKMSGGDIDSEEVKYKPGAMAPELSLGGSVTVSNITVERLFELGRDTSIIPQLKSWVGKGEVTVVKQPLDINGAPYGTPMVYQGKLKTFTPPPVDSNATSSAATLTLVISSAGVVS